MDDFKPNKEMYYPRLKAMDELGKSLVPEIGLLESLLHPYQLVDGNNFFKYCFSNLEKKLESKPLRAYFAKAIYEYLCFYPVWQKAFQKYDQKLFTQKLPFLFELVIGVQYLHNFILDEKLGANEENPPKRNQYLIASNFLKEQSFMYIEQEITPLLRPCSTLDLRETIRNLYLCVDWGQYLDKEHNHYESWLKNGKINALPLDFFFDSLAEESIQDALTIAKKLTPGKEHFTEIYFRRIYYSNVYFFRCMVEILARIAGLEENTLTKDLKRLAMKYSFMLQIINDYADFAYSDEKKERELLRTAGKKQTDFFADLYNFNITLPLIFHLQQGHKRKIETYLEAKKKDRTLFELYPNQIKVEIVSSGAIPECIDLSQKLSMSARAELPKDKNPMSPYLEDLCGIAFDNKFFSAFNH